MVSYNSHAILRTSSETVSETVSLAMRRGQSHSPGMGRPDPKILALQRQWVQDIMQHLNVDTHTRAAALINENLRNLDKHRPVPRSFHVASFQRVMAGTATSLWGLSTIKKIVAGSGVPFPPALIHGRYDLSSLGNEKLVEASQTAEIGPNVVGGDDEMRIAKGVIRGLLENSSLTPTQLARVCLDVGDDMEREARIGGKNP